MMLILRLIAVALLAAGAVLLRGPQGVAAPFDQETCETLEAEKKALFTPEIAAALERGPDWVKDHLNSESIEKVRAFLVVEELVAFRCRTDGVVMPDPDDVPLPDRKPSLPATETAEEGPSQTLAGAAAATLLPLRKPSLDPTGDAPSQGEADADEAPPTSETAQAGPDHEAGDADDATAGPSASGPSQTVADSDKTAAQ